MSLLGETQWFVLFGGRGGGRSGLSLLRGRVVGNGE